MTRFVALALASLAAACSAGVTSPVQSVINTPPAPTLLSTRYQFSCGGWHTGVAPPIDRTVFDVLVTEGGFDALPEAGGRLIYTFHGGMYRIEIDTAAIGRLATGRNSPLYYARNVTDLDNLTVPFAAGYDHKVTDQDVVSLVSAGAFQISWYPFSYAAGGFIDDNRWPELTALPIEFLGYNFPVLCLG